MFIIVGSQLAYRQLLTVDPNNMDPSEMLNLVDLARQEARRSTDPATAEQVEAKCRSIELDVHLTYTPPSLALVCCE
jgi:hypothetical protein